MSSVLFLPGSRNLYADHIVCILHVPRMRSQQVVCRHELLRGSPYAHVDVVGLSALFGLKFRS